MNVQPLTDETLEIAPKSQPQNEMIFWILLTCYRKALFKGFNNKERVDFHQEK